MGVFQEPLGRLESLPVTAGLQSEAKQGEVQQQPARINVEFKSINQHKPINWCTE